MKTLQVSAISPSATKSFTPLSNIAFLEENIAIIKGELDFYDELLSWLLLSCHEGKRHAIEQFQADVKNLRNGGFSALLNGMDSLRNNIQEGKDSDVHSDVAHLQLYFNQIDKTFQVLKSVIHKRFCDFTHIRIW